jgi:hypothetical protein
MSKKRTGPHQNYLIFRPLKKMDEFFKKKFGLISMFFFKLGSNETGNICMYNGILRRVHATKFTMGKQ